MPYDPQRQQRQSIRLPGHDYSLPGAYFVTLCTQWREHVLVDSVVSGIIVDVWRALPGWFPTIALDDFVVMPNHVHFVIWLQTSAADIDHSPCVLTWLDWVAEHTDVYLTEGGSPSTIPNYAQDLGALQGGWTIPQPEATNSNPSLGDVVSAFKSLVFSVYLDWINTHGLSRRAKFWQRNYYEHIVRDVRELNAIRRYIRANPENWLLDRDNPTNIVHLPLPTRIEDYLEDISPLL